MPGDLRRPQPAAREGKRARARARRALPRGDRNGAERPSAGERPPGDVAIHRLFVGDAYETKVQGWLALADAAVAALH
eukprot:5639716-Pleurochrysis_carterae.AAC.1